VALLLDTYLVQYDTTDFVAAQTRTNATVVTITINGRHIPTRSSSEVTYGTPKASGPGTSIYDYKLADQYLEQLAKKSGGRLSASDSLKKLCTKSSPCRDLKSSPAISAYLCDLCVTVVARNI
jgi:hypothetical protein